MNAVTNTLEHSTDRHDNWRTQFARRLVLRQLQQLANGQLVIRENGRQHVFGNPSQRPDLCATVDVTHPNLWLDILARGVLGAGEAFMKGYWQSRDVVSVIRVFCANRHVMTALDGRLAAAGRPLLRVLHWLNRNTETNARRNIAAHYDLGNELFELFLDPSMMYSSAIYPQATSTLEEASVYKLDRICRKLALTPADHLLEIGTGWGGLAVHAATHYGCRVTTTTISQAQHDAAVARVKAAGLEDRVTVLLSDYRDLVGQYDKLVSVEMIEAVGHQYLDTYFHTLSERLKPGGLALIQAITIADQEHDAALRRVDFIQRYIFPGGFLPCVSSMLHSVSRQTDFALIHQEDIGLHYARTLADWRKRFVANLPAIKALGYSDTFIRMWLYYFCYCEGGFRERAIGTSQLLLAKPGYRVRASAD